MRRDRFQVFDAGARQRQQAVVDRLKVLANHMQARFRHQAVDLFNPAGGGVLQRNHRQSRFAALDHKHRFNKAFAGAGRQLRVHVAAGKMGIGPFVALIGDNGVGGHGIHTD